jgi:trehalose 6-phosphate synthase/phosphatase
LTPIHGAGVATSNQVPANKDGLIVVSNRLPVVMRQSDDGWDLLPGGGGLVQALDPVLHASGGVWVGWPGVANECEDAIESLIEAEGQRRGYRFVPVMLDEATVKGFYCGFANEVLWPLFHNLDGHVRYEPNDWQAYADANRIFAERALEAGDGLVWVHDYHLIRCGEELRARDPQRTLAFFLHIPFPPAETFVKLPWREEILAALLAYDLVGFQTAGDLTSFLDCVARMATGAQMREAGGGLAEIVLPNGRVVRAGAFPISIDYRAVNAQAQSAPVVKRLKELKKELGDRAVVLGVDRLDYTKGIPERLAGFRELFARAPELCGKVTLVQIVEPSRTVVPEYQELKLAIDRQIGAINGELGTTSWVPVQYLYRSFGHDELFAMYRQARVALVTPLRDGMNLVAKEYCAAQVECTGALVLSEFAGAAAQLAQGALLVNPYDAVATADALQHALTMDANERKRRMRVLRDAIAAEDVFWWTRRFLAAARAGMKRGDADVEAERASAPPP